MDYTTELESIERIIKGMSNVKYLAHGDDSVSFQFHDKDGDDMTGAIKIIDKKELSVITSMAIPASHAVSAMLACNSYNQRNDIYGTFSYAGKVGEDRYAAVLESDIDTSDGINEMLISHQIQNFIDHINLWETKVIDSLKELGEDKSFLKGGFFSQLGQFFGGVLPIMAPILLGGDASSDA